MAKESMPVSRWQNVDSDHNPEAILMVRDEGYVDMSGTMIGPTSPEGKGARRPGRTLCTVRLVVGDKSLQARFYADQLLETLKQLPVDKV